MSITKGSSSADDFDGSTCIKGHDVQGKRPVEYCLGCRRTSGFAWYGELTFALIASLWAQAGCGGHEAPSAALGIELQAPPAKVSPELERRISAFCGDCHAVPLPESFSRDRWHVEVLKGYEIYGKSGRSDLDPPPLSQTLAYYRARAPEELVFPTPQDAPGYRPVTFATERLFLNSTLGMLPEIGHLRWTRLAADKEPILIACDMRYGHVVAIDLKREGRAAPRLLAMLRNPCRIEACDLDKDGATDLVVADLGSFQPAEHDRGRAVWLRPDGQGGYDVRELAGGLGRVADVRVADIDADDRLDLLVAEFGWQQTGGILWLRNVSQIGESPRFESTRIDNRPGAIHLPIHDLNGDGQLDFVALVSQQYEAVDVFLGTGRGKFVRRNAWAAPDLTFGSTGIEFIDLDGDGDQDILYTNGDAFDNNLASPWHGVQWLENSGGGRFRYHRLTDMIGAYRALAADFDGDGDHDIVAVSFLPPKLQPAHLRNAETPSIVFLEQLGPGKFSRYILERGSPFYATLETADFDSDGDADFVVGSGPTVAEERKDKHYLTIWWNETIERAADAQ